MIRFVARTIRFVDVRHASARPSQALPPLFGQVCRTAPNTLRGGKIFFVPGAPTALTFNEYRKVHASLQRRNKNGLQALAGKIPVKDSYAEQIMPTGEGEQQ